MKTACSMLIVLAAAVLSGGCSVSVPKVAAFVPVDTGKYKSQESLQGALAEAKKACMKATANSGLIDRSANDVQNTAFAGREKSADLALCMIDRGFVQKTGSPPIIDGKT